MHQTNTMKLKTRGLIRGNSDREILTIEESNFAFIYDNHATYSKWPIKLEIS